MHLPLYLHSFTSTYMCTKVHMYFSTSCYILSSAPFITPLDETLVRIRARVHHLAVQYLHYVKGHVFLFCKIKRNNIQTMSGKGNSCEQVCTAMFVSREYTSTLPGLFISTVCRFISERHSL